MGCRVVVLSGSDRKREEAFKLGAHEFVATRDAKELSISAQINRLLVTAAVPPDWSLLVPILAPRAAIYPLTVNMGKISIPCMALISRGIHILGSQVPGRAIHKQMLEFAALHHVEPITETFAMTEEKITEAMDKLDRGEMYYRAVLIPQ
jgi:D-arabinose 1-dehydrogenase-like Zn-dependent alcohol dehydrogenase